MIKRFIGSIYIVHDFCVCFSNLCTYTTLRLPTLPTQVLVPIMPAAILLAFATLGRIENDAALAWYTTNYADVVGVYERMTENIAPDVQGIDDRETWRYQAQIVQTIIGRAFVQWFEIDPPAAYLCAQRIIQGFTEEGVYVKGKNKETRDYNKCCGMLRDKNSQCSECVRDLMWL